MKFYHYFADRETKYLLKKSIKKIVSRQLYLIWLSLMQILFLANLSRESYLFD